MRTNRLTYLAMTVAALAFMSVLNHGSARAAESPAPAFEQLVH